MHTCFQFPCLGKTLIPTGKPESFSVYIYASYYLEIFMPHLLKYKSRHRNFFVFKISSNQSIHYLLQGKIIVKSPLGKGI